MEKYGVDKENDPVEKKAQDMVKTGAAKTLDEGRRIAAQEENSDEQLQSGEDIRKAD